MIATSGRERLSMRIAATIATCCRQSRTIRRAASSNRSVVVAESRGGMSTGRRSAHGAVMSSLAVILAVVLMIVWLICLIALGIFAVETWISRGWKRGLPVAAAGILLFAVPVGLAGGVNDPNANRLCLSGHQEWRSSYRAPILAGKVIVPGGTSTSKVWVCERWEA